jgi:hypothetical protein
MINQIDSYNEDKCVQECEAGEDLNLTLIIMIGLVLFHYICMIAQKKLRRHILSGKMVGIKFINQDS